MKYCESCGNQLQDREVGISWYCLHCKRYTYANPVPVIDVMFTDEKGKILLGRRAQDPEKGRLNLPGGFVDPNETFEEALAREIKEELNLDPGDYGSFVYAGSRIFIHSQNGRDRQLIGIIMRATIAHREFMPNEEVSEYLWKLPSELAPEDVTNQAEYDHIMRATKIK